MKALVIVASIIIISCASPKRNDLEDNIQTKQFTYIDWACACANWATTANAIRYKDTGKLSTHCFFIEPKDSLVKLADTLGYSGDIIEFTGQFYKNKGYPKGYIKTEEPLDSAKVFRYTRYKVIRSMYHSFKNNLKN